MFRSTAHQLTSSLAAVTSLPAAVPNRRRFLAVAGLVVGAGLLCGAPDAMLKDWGVDLLLALDVRADLVWILVLDSPDLWHVMVFAALALGILAAAPSRPRLGVQIAALLAVSMEFAQRFAPSRSANLEDVLLNFAGVGVGWLAWRARKWVRPGGELVS